MGLLRLETPFLWGAGTRGVFDPETLLSRCRGFKPLQGANGFLILTVCPLTVYLVALRSALGGEHKGASHEKLRAAPS